MASFSTTEQTTISPHTQQPLVTRTYPSQGEVDAAIRRAREAQVKWREVSLDERVKIGERFMEEFKKMSDEILLELTMQIGRPVSQTPGEIRGFLDRASYMLSIAKSSLADVSLKDTDKPGFRRWIKRVPLGVVLVVAPWNYPYLVSVNSVLPAIIAGNTVLLKPSPQTPLTAERFATALHRAGVPEDAVQVLHLPPALTSFAASHPLVDFVSFTGSVEGGLAVQKAALEATSSGFKGVALELGGKDPAYVRADADLDYTAGEVVDGAFFNSGQSCCAIERVYVHELVYNKFVDKVVALVKRYTLGDPTLPNTTLGPVVSVTSAEKIRKQVEAAVKAGAKVLISEELFPAAKPGTTYVSPQVLVDVDHTMEVMTEETFGPVVGIQKVSSDEEAVALMNDSRYGLTASVWTKDEDAFLRIEDKLETGTVFLNRCDYLDPALAWTGVKDSGRGVSLSKFGYDQLTRAKSVHMKIVTS
ncbi:aldehyde dehydrogenase [Neolentinus lepideus HHB14362 ss-1]|uniref:Aldehyde dehydrogenase n=1 Tax=Neolentinus lepideus HHB14362 ss-1 TaxID=1314782 RepID=A0A165P9S0_9AGAM|nr:aldehyde dehydrogenase [Neolentinus lepideus HHB14362 ss-1]